MATLPSGSSASISFLDIYNNINSTSGTPVASIGLKDLSETLADGSIVNPLSTSKRDAIRSAPYAIDEVWGANYPSSILSNMTIKREGSNETQFVDGETLQVGYDITADWDPDPYDSGDSISNIIQIIDSGDNVDLSGTNSISDSAPSGTQIKSFSSLALVAGVYKVKIILDSSNTFNQIVNTSAFTHYDQLTGASINAVSTQYVNASSDTNAITFGHTNTNGVVTSRGWTFTNASNGNGSAISITTSAGATPTVTFTGTGTFPIGLSLYGNPSTARNVDTDSTNVNVQYVNAIDSITQSQGNVNVSAVDGSNNATFTCYSEGYVGTLTIGYDTNNTTTDTTYTNTTEPVSTLYQRETITKHLTISSAGTYYPKAHHDGNAVVGSSFIVAPQLSFSTTGNDSISVGDTSHAFKATSPVGRNFSMTISANSAGSPSTTDYATGFTIAPGTQDGQYTITYNASADFSQTGPDQTDILYVYPDAAFSVSDTTLLINSPAGSGLSDDNLSISNTSVGANISALLWTITKDEDGGFSETSTDPAVSVTSGTLESSYGEGNYNVSLRVTGGGGLQNTETDNAAFTITTHPPQVVNISAPNGNILRRGSAFTIQFTKTSAVYVNLHLYRDVLLNGSYTKDSDIDIAGNNTGTSYSWTVPGGQALVNDRYKVYGFVVNGTATDLGSAFSIRDGLVGIPTSLTATAGNGSAAISWTDGAYNGGGNTVYIYDSGQSQEATSVQSGTSYTYPYSSDNQHTVYFKVLGTNESGESSGLSSFSSAVIVYPVLGGTKNVIAPNISTIYSTYLNNNTGTHPTTVTYNTPTTPTNNVTSRTYSTSALTGHVFGNSSATSHAATTTTYGGGTGVGSRTITLAIAGSGNPSQNSSTTHGVTINYQPRIISTTSTSTIQQNVTDVIVQTVYWQGYASSGFTARVINSSGTTINSNGTVSIVGSNFTNSLGISGAGGTQTTDSEWFAKGGSANVCNLGTISATGAQTLRITSTGAATDFDHPISITGWNSITITSKSTGGWSNQEDPVPPAPDQGSPTSKYYLGSLGDGIVLYNTESDSSPFNGGTYYHHDGSNNYVMTVSAVGVVGNYTADTQAQPKAPTLNAFSGITTSQIVINWNDNSRIEDNYYLYQDDSSAASISNYDNVYTIAQNVETYPNTSLTTNTPSTSLTATAHPTINGRIDLSWSVSGHTSFVVYEGTSWPPSTSIATSGTSATRTGLADSQIYYYSIIAQGSGKTYYYGLYAKNGNTLSSIAQGSSATTAGVHTTYDDATTIAAAADPTVSITCTASSYWNAGTGVWAKSTFLDGFTIQTDTFTVTSADRDGNIVRLQVWQTNGGFFEWKDQTSDSSWHSGAPSNGWAYVGSSTSAEVNMEDNNTNYFRLQREMNSSGANSPDLKVRCRVIKGGTSYYSNAIIFRPDGIFS